MLTLYSRPRCAAGRVKLGLEVFILSKVHDSWRDVTSGMMWASLYQGLGSVLVFVVRVSLSLAFSAIRGGMDIGQSREGAVNDHSLSKRVSSLIYLSLFCDGVLSNLVKALPHNI